MRRVLIPEAVPPAPPVRIGAGISILRGKTMGTTWDVKLVAPEALSLVDLLEGIQRELDCVVAQMSTWEPASDLSRFNRAPDGTWHVLPDEFFTVLRYALSVAEESGGACYLDSAAISSEARHNRSVLATVLSEAGLVNYPTEWWHWSFGDRYWAHVTGRPFAIHGPVHPATRPVPSNGLL